jgi:hypothetical protein
MATRNEVAGAQISNFPTSFSTMAYEIFLNPARRLRQVFDRNEAVN